VSSGRGGYGAGSYNPAPMQKGRGGATQSGGQGGDFANSFCNDCGAKYQTPVAKFCGDCGSRK